MASGCEALYHPFADMCSGIDSAEKAKTNCLIQRAQSRRHLFGVLVCLARGQTHIARWERAGGEGGLPSPNGLIVTHNLAAVWGIVVFDTSQRLPAR